MMNNGDKEAFAIAGSAYSKGLTKREYFAVAAMQGYLGSGIRDFTSHPADAAYWAVKQADDLLAALEKMPPRT